jgi:hypothetical protein
MSKPEPQLIVNAPLATIARLAGEEYLRKASAEAFTFVCPDGDPGKTLLKYAAAGLAGHLTAESFPWPLTGDEYRAGLERLGVKRDLAQLVQDQLAAAGSLRPAAERPGPGVAADFLLSRLGANPYAQLKGIRPVDAPAADEPAPAVGPPERDPNPVVADLANYPHHSEV